MVKKIVIYGAGGFGREVLQVINDINAASQSPQWEPLGFLVDKEYISSDLINGLPILGSIDWISERVDISIISAVGSSMHRRRISNHVEILCGNIFATLIHPRAWVGSHVKIGAGTIVCAGALITSNIEIGSHVHINIGATIGHDAILRDYVTINPSVNISGNVEIGVGCEIGTGSVIIPKIEVGEWTIVGAGSVVTKFLPANVTAVGAPARVVKQRESGWQEPSVNKA